MGKGGRAPRRTAVEFHMLSRCAAIPVLPVAEWKEMDADIVNAAGRTRHVLVVENQQLLGAGIERLLRREADLRVTGVMADDEAAYLQEIDDSRPDVVVLDAAAADSDQLCKIIQDSCQVQVVEVSADKGLVWIYEKRQVVVKHAAELAALIRQL